MAIVKQPKKKCGHCRHCDRETYKGARAIVCYNLSLAPWGKRVAMAISEKQEACSYYTEKA